MCAGRSETWQGDKSGGCWRKGRGGRGKEGFGRVGRGHRYVALTHSFLNAHSSGNQPGNFDQIFQAKT